MIYQYHCYDIYIASSVLACGYNRDDNVDNAMTQLVLRNTAHDRLCNTYSLRKS